MRTTFPAARPAHAGFELGDGEVGAADFGFGTLG